MALGVRRPPPKRGYRLNRFRDRCNKETSSALNTVNRVSVFQSGGNTGKLTLNGRLVADKCLE